MRPTAQIRFWRKVGLDVARDICWPWMGFLDRDGYGIFNPTRTENVRAHRWIYEEIMGPIPEGLTIDHLCRNRACVNPRHMEPVTVRENTMRGIGITAQNARKTHCVNGHALSGYNVKRGSDGGRRCRICSNKSAQQWQRKYRARKRLAAI